LYSYQQLCPLLARVTMPDKIIIIIIALCIEECNNSLVAHHYGNNFYRHQKLSGIELVQGLQEYDYINKNTQTKKK
jgi:hypothetical protein